MGVLPIITRYILVLLFIYYVVGLSISQCKDLSITTEEKVSAKEENIRSPELISGEENNRRSPEVISGEENRRSPEVRGLHVINHNHVCCTREKRLKTIGKKGTGEELTVDIGFCRKRCPPKKPLKKKKFEKLLLENPGVDPREIFLLHNSKRRRKPSCSNGYTCSETSSRMEKILTVEGEVSLNIIESCFCKIDAKLCRRQSKIMTFYKRTPLETSIDVGECHGHCGQETKCRPVVTKTTSIQGPNGAECVTVIEGCSCSWECYKVSHYEQFYDYLDGVPVAKVIDVGKCAGNCSQRKEEKCLLRKADDDSCLMSLSPKQTECHTLEIDYNIITDETGLSRNISSISSCSCN